MLKNVKIVDNQPKCACVLLVDTSGSMAGEKIDSLNAGLRSFKESLENDDSARVRVDVAVVSFDDQVRVAHAFCSPPEFNPPTLSAQGRTRLAEGIGVALKIVKQRREEYKAAGVGRYRPWIVLISDGEPTDSDAEFEKAVQDVATAENARQVILYAVGVDGASREKLARLSTKQAPVLLKGLRFAELFSWLSASMTAVSQGKVSDDVQIPVTGSWADNWKP